MENKRVRINYNIKGTIEFDVGDSNLDKPLINELKGKFREELTSSLNYALKYIPEGSGDKAEFTVTKVAIERI
jgi:hypothetical protein